MRLHAMVVMIRASLRAVVGIVDAVEITLFYNFVGGGCLWIGLIGGRRKRRYIHVLIPQLLVVVVEFGVIPTTW